MAGSSRQLPRLTSLTTDPILNEINDWLITDARRSRIMIPEIISITNEHKLNSQKVLEEHVDAQVKYTMKTHVFRIMLDARYPFEDKQLKAPDMLAFIKNFIKDEYSYSGEYAMEFKERNAGPGDTECQKFAKSIGKNDAKQFGEWMAERATAMAEKMVMELED